MFNKKVVPAFEKFQKELQLKDPYTGFAIFYAGECDGTNDFVALEDLSEYGFGTAPR